MPITTLSTTAVFTTIVSAPVMSITRMLGLRRRSGRHRSPLVAVGCGLRAGGCLRDVGCSMRRADRCARALLVTLLVTVLLGLLVGPRSGSHLLRLIRRFRRPFGRLRVDSVLVTITVAEHL
ncbi:MAG: hypothetical protein KAW49_10210, partial [Anaerolineae bacterium]|nr:hypothetical protein [Anaerolineae bacterium]